MVKLFGWEQKMSEQIDQKRVEELKLVRELKFLRSLNGSLKYVFYYCRSPKMNLTLRSFLVRFSVTIFIFFVHVRRTAFYDCQSSSLFHAGCCAEERIHRFVEISITHNGHVCVDMSIFIASMVFSSLVGALIRSLPGPYVILMFTVNSVGNVGRQTGEFLPNGALNRNRCLLCHILP